MNSESAIQHTASHFVEKQRTELTRRCCKQVICISKSQFQALIQLCSLLCPYFWYFSEQNYREHFISSAFYSLQAASAISNATGLVLSNPIQNGDKISFFAAPCNRRTLVQSWKATWRWCNTCEGGGRIHYIGGLICKAREIVYSCERVRKVIVFIFDLRWRMIVWSRLAIQFLPLAPKLLHNLY